MPAKPHVIIVGAGIVGLANALAAQQAGWRVSVFERNHRSLGASVRNFGMFWPIAQKTEFTHRMAMQGRETWVRLAEATGLHLRPCGSLFLAINPDELALMEEFSRHQAAEGLDLEFLGKDETLARSAIANPKRVLGGLYSPHEANIDPREAIAKIADYLNAQDDVEVHFSAPVSRVSGNQVTLSDGRKLEAERIVICQGDDAQQLFPDIMAAQTELRSCKLHMLRSTPFKRDIGPMIASALSLRHYEPFEVCQSFRTYSDRISAEKPEIDRFGIHVMASQSRSGHLVLGDSHQYDLDEPQFDEAQIDEIILRELGELLEPELVVDQRWKGFYQKREGHLAFIHDVDDHTRIFNGLGGSGMTQSFGYAAQLWQDWNNPLLVSGVPG